MHEVDALERGPERICRASHLWTLWGCHHTRAACQKERMPFCLFLDGQINVRTRGDLHSQYTERWEALERQINAHLTAQVFTFDLFPERRKPLSYLQEAVR